VELLERGPALAALHSALDAALGGAGRVAAVSGEAGHREDEPRRGVPRGPRRVGRACSPAPATTCSPPAPSARCTTSRTGSADAPALLDAAVKGRYGAVAEALRTEPTVLVVEDVHWADEATLDWLAHLGRRLAELPVLLVLTFRDDDPESTTSIARVLATLPRRRVVRLPLAVLSPDAVAVLAGPRSAEVYALTGGSPLLVTELLAGGGAEVPPSIRESVLGRLAAAPPVARPAIEVVALVPGICEWWLVEGAAAGGLDAVAAAMRTGLLVAEEAGVRFRHELTRRVVEEALFVPRRHALHRRLLAVLEARADADPARLAHHARSAAEPRAILRHAVAAGKRAAAARAHREAAAQLGAALEHAGLLRSPSARASWSSSPWRRTSPTAPTTP
jgi:hypothetical protein